MNSPKHDIGIGFIGGAASAIATATYFVRDLKADAVLRDRHVNIYVFDPEGLNPGPPYRFSSDAFVLNQPAGEEMNPFQGGGAGLPSSFMEWGAYGAETFPSRRAFGDYLGDVAAALPRPDADDTVAVHEIRNFVARIDEMAVPFSGHRYRAETDDGKTFPLDGFVLATGHSFSPRLEHERYLAAYSGKDYEQRLVTSAADANRKIVIGSGASMADNICALEYFGNRGDYRVFSPYGSTGWAYVPDAPRPAENAVRNYTAILAETGGDTSGMAASVRRTLQAAAKNGIAPQYLLTAALTDTDVGKDPNRLKVIEAFYGNPLSPERFSILSNLERDGRLEYDLRRVDDIKIGPDNLRVHVGDAAIACPGYIIDCAIVHRGIRDARGGIANPLIAQLVDDRIISVSQKNRNEIDPLTAPEKLIFSVGAPTNALKNGIETFTPFYRTVAAKLTARLREYVLESQPARARERYNTPIILPATP